MNSDDRTYAISAANLQVIEKSINYLANNIDSVDVRVEDVNEKINKVRDEVKTMSLSAN